MAMVIVKVEPQIGATDENYLQEQQAAAEADVQTILENTQKEAEGYEVAEMQAEQLVELPTVPLQKKEALWPYVAGAAGLLLVITLISK